MKDTKEKKKKKKKEKHKTKEKTKKSNMKRKVKRNNQETKRKEEEMSHENNTTFIKFMCSLRTCWTSPVVASLSGSDFFNIR